MSIQLTWYSTSEWRLRVLFSFPSYYLPLSFFYISFRLFLLPPHIFFTSSLFLSLLFLSYIFLFISYKPSPPRYYTSFVICSLDWLVSRPFSSFTLSLSFFLLSCFNYLPSPLFYLSSSQENIICIHSLQAVALISIPFFPPPFFSFSVTYCLFPLFSHTICKPFYWLAVFFGFFLTTFISPAYL